jgi:hypothetical protein
MGSTIAIILVFAMMIIMLVTRERKVGS